MFRNASFPSSTKLSTESHPSTNTAGLSLLNAGCVVPQVCPGLNSRLWNSSRGLRDGSSLGTFPENEEQHQPLSSEEEKKKKRPPETPPPAENLSCFSKELLPLCLNVGDWGGGVKEGVVGTSVMRFSSAALRRCQETPAGSGFIKTMVGGWSPPYTAVWHVRCFTFTWMEPIPRPNGTLLIEDALEEKHAILSPPKSPNSPGSSLLSWTTSGQSLLCLSLCFSFGFMFYIKLHRVHRYNNK